MLPRRLWWRATPRDSIRSWQPFRFRRPFSGNRGPDSSSREPVSRVARVESKLPRFLQRFVTPLRHAPVSHVVAFLILHEITAIVPLIALAGTFHYTHWLPPFISEGKWISDGVEKFGRYFRRKGWITDAQEAEAEAEVEGDKKGKLRKAVSSVGGKWWGRGEGGVRLLVEVATAYAITKALLPLRLVVSVWATPWFARWSVLPVTRYFKKGFGSRTKVSSAAGTGAVGGGVLPKDVGGKG
ncbi:hypothetical protein D0861_01376 [Hortaea werneckii]|uniref:Uncharacterized protein n=1 Tax=Hortaea werneckii TaxID=91943 RepID=A0A3M7G0C8_HORWE|nr:hypothetical protein D0861_01376 [Hortaea werneckii]